MLVRNWSVDVKALGDRIAALTAAGAAELGDYLESVHRIRPSGVVPVIEKRDERPAPPPEPTEFHLVLQGYDPARKLHVMRAVREQTGLGLKGAKEAVEAAPRLLRSGLSRADAEALKGRLEAEGATVSLEPVTE